MRELISGVAFLLAFLVVIGSAWAFIFPAKFAKKDEPIPTRKSIFFSAIFATFILSGIGFLALPGNPTQPDSQQISDAQKLKQLRADITAIEQQFSQQETDFSSVLQRIYLKKEVTDAERSKPVAISFGEMLETLEKANSVNVPDIAQPDAKRYATNAVDAHKKWALTMQAKVAAISKGNMDQVQSMGARADSYAMDEAVALGLAYKALGLPIQ